MNEYAKVRGIAFQENTDPEALAMARSKPAPAPLSEKQKEIVGRRRELVHKHMPELVPEIKAMVEAGLIDGWRNITSIKVFETGETI